jgi:ADP-L-glycero-D-manno-heptose 6-epimerase
MHLLITGAAGFIGSHVARRALQLGHQVTLVDQFQADHKRPNWENIQPADTISRDVLPELLKTDQLRPDAILHLGARTNTMERDMGLLRRLNTDYTKYLWQYCTKHQVPFLYASSAATYGNGELGYSDDHALLDQLKPLNPYAVSKHAMDVFALQEKQTPPFWAGLKFFNVYGPGENHKGRMASVVWHGRNQLMETGSLSLFRSHRADIADGAQQRDFIYVKDVVSVLFWLLDHTPASGMYNVGSGQARTFLDLAKAVVKETLPQASIRFIDMPEHLRANYQYFTEARMEKLRRAGYDSPFTPLEEGVRQYLAQWGKPL